MYDFDSIASLLPFISQAFDASAEILLCDVKSIRYAVNPLSEHSQPGNPIGDMEKSFLREGIYRSQDSVLNYRALSPSRTRLRASTHFLLDEDGELAGFLTINMPIERLLKVREVVDSMINGETIPLVAAPVAKQAPAAKKRRAAAPPISRYEGVNMAVQDIIQSVTDEFMASYGIPADRLTASERVKIVCELDHRGVFLVKGSIAEVASRLNCSEATIYRYLQQME